MFNVTMFQFLFQPQGKFDKEIQEIIQKYVFTNPPTKL